MTAAAFVFAWFLAHGAPEPYAHALVKQARIESGLMADPPKTGMGNCLYQWVGVRWRRLRQWSRSADCPALETQLQFAMAELSEPEFACFWQAPPSLAFTTLRRTFGAGGRC